MNRIRFCSAILATLGLTSAAQAGIFDFLGHGSGKGCADCAAPCQVECCRPTIPRPCGVSVHVYQRACSNFQAPCGDVGCAPKACCPPQCVAPAPACCAPQSCAPAPVECCAPAPAGCAPQCAAPAPGCCAPETCGCSPCTCGGSGHPFGFLGGIGDALSGAGDRVCGLFGGGKGRCDQGCAGGCPEQRCCNADPCVIAELIYQSQTACYADDREDAIDKLGDYDCACNPEILSAMVYALNDADDDVREEAADELGDVLKKNPCCCSPEIVAALTCALADCDKGVRKQAEEALCICGYDVIDGCCDTSCGPTCGPGVIPGGVDPVGPPTDPMGPESAPAPVPLIPDADAAPPAPGAQETYFPSRLQDQQATRSNRRLANLFGLLK